VVRHLVELHGGAVAARSSGAGCGSEFEVRLPARSGAPSELLPEREPSDRIRSAPETRRVLVVDDNQDAAETLYDLLTLWDFQVEVAGDGEQALELAERFQPHAVLLDIGLPGMDGYAVCRRLRELEQVEARETKRRRGAGETRKPMVLVAVTGYGLSEDRRRSREAGFDHHLAKPVDPEALRELLHRELSKDASPACDSAATA
jgi:CheY-like chemotaxis protein